MKRSRAVALAVLGLLDLLAVAYIWSIPKMEADLTQRAEQELAAAGIENVTVEFDGRHGSLSGADATAAELQLASLRGARSVRSNAPAPSTTAVVFTSRNGRTARLEGVVASESRRQALTEEVTAAGFDVDDALTVDNALDESGVNGVLPLIGPILEGSDDGQLTLESGSITITGAAADPVEAEVIAAAVDTAEATGVVIDNKLTVVELSEAQQITALQIEIDQIFELARALEGQEANFNTSDERLSPQTTNSLDRVIVAMRRYPLPAADIVGHTDSEGPAQSNLLLSETRAESVMDYLLSGGVDSERLTAIGRGETEPIADNQTLSGRKQNRRVDFIVKKSGG